MKTIDRRRFAQLALCAPFVFRGHTSEALETTVRTAPGSRSHFPILDVTGSYREIGFAVGRRFRKNIREVIRRRAEWHQGLLTILQSPAGRRHSQKLLDLTRKHFPHFLDELRGMAEGAGLHFDAIWAMTVKSELGALETENPGCSTIVFSDERRTWLCHNEDGHAAYTDLMFVLRVSPPSGVDFISMVYPGILTGNGPSMNSHGVIQSTNYIGSVRSAVGLPRYVIGRAILEATSLDEARGIATVEPRAYPYHHNLGGVEGRRYVSVETVPGATGVAEPRGLYIHTNHLLHDATKGYPHEDQLYKGSSSMSRYSVLQRLAKGIEAKGLKPETLLGFLSSHEQAPYSPCRHPKGDVRGQTLGTAFFDIGRGVFRLYKGNPCEAVAGEAFAEYHF